MTRKTIQVYGIDPNTREYSPIMNDVAYECELEKGTFHIPANSTEISPPELGKYQAAVFSNGKWKVVPDFRGVTFKTKEGSEITIDTLGVSPPEYSKMKEELPEPELQEVIEESRLQAKKRVKDGYYWQLCFGAMTTSSGISLNCRRAGATDDIAQLSSLLRVCKSRKLSGKSSLPGKGLRTLDNTFVEVTVGDLEKVILPEMDQHMVSLAERKWELEEKIDSLTELSEIEAVNWSTQ